MKRMSEVFVLPAKNVYGSALAKYSRKEVTQHASHAINHVDALADTLETVLTVLSGKTEFDSSEIDLDSCYAALNSYRGA